MCFVEALIDTRTLSGGVFSDVIFYPCMRITIVSGIKNYPSALHLVALIVTALRSLKSGIREYISPGINFCLYLCESCSTK